MLLKEVCNLLATAWKVAQLKVMQISLIIEVVTQHSAFTNSSMIKRAQVHCQNMDREVVPKYLHPLVSILIMMKKRNQMKLNLAPVKIMLRYTLSLPMSAAAKSRYAHVLSCVCIISLNRLVY